jgi:Ca-activated chloride channel family protein
LFDVSLSMTAKDIKPDRFSVAKQSLIEFINSLDTDYNIWMITFSWKPFVYIPISNDKKTVIRKIKNMLMSDFPPTLDFVWTAIGDAILLWTNQLLNYTKNSKQPWVIILLTDWDSNKWINPDQAIKYAKEKKIPIFVWAIWKNYKYIVWEDIFWNDVPTSIDLSLLKKIAQETWWEFKKIENKEDFIQILSKLYSYVKTYEQIKQIKIYSYINYYLKRILLILLLIYWIFFVRFSMVNSL